MKLSEQQYLTFSINDKGEKIYHVKTPCKFIIEEELVEELKRKYKPKEEIGGLIWVKPKMENKETEFIADKVSFIRNAIEDIQTGRTKKNTYRFDKKEYLAEKERIFAEGYIPLKFHTHPTKGNSFMEEFEKFAFQRDTSDKDKESSDNPYVVNKEKLLMPNGLIVGNKIVEDNIFIGLYNGFIAPKGFEEAKKEVISEKINNTSKMLSGMKLTANQKILLGIGGALILAGIIKYRKSSLPVIFTIASILPVLLSDTNEPTKYYNQLSRGDAIIEIPNYDNK